MTVLTNARIVLHDQVILGSLALRGSLIEAVSDFESGRTEMLTAVLKNENGDVLAVLGGVHVNARGGSDPYGRVVEAELSQEALAAENSSSRAMALNPAGRHAANWRTMLDLPGVERRLGATHVADVLAHAHPAAYCKSRASGYWDANEPEYFEAYTSLARMIDDGEMDDLLAAARRGK